MDAGGARAFLRCLGVTWWAVCDVVGDKNAGNALCDVVVAWSGAREAPNDILDGWAAMAGRKAVRGDILL